MSDEFERNLSAALKLVTRDVNAPAVIRGLAVSGELRQGPLTSRRRYFRTSVSLALSVILVCGISLVVVFIRRGEHRTTPSVAYATSGTRDTVRTSFGALAIAFPVSWRLWRADGVSRGPATPLGFLSTASETIPQCDAASGESNVVGSHCGAPVQKLLPGEILVIIRRIDFKTDQIKFDKLINGIRANIKENVSPLNACPTGSTSSAIATYDGTNLPPANAGIYELDVCENHSSSDDRSAIDNLIYAASFDS